MFSKYLKAGRLADVLALMQVLALDKDVYRSEQGLKEELQGNPNSAGSWLDVGAEHPEFFRVSREREHPVSLVARHVTPKIGEIRTLPPGFLDTLVRTAVDLHDREARRLDRRWQIFQAVLSGFAGGTLPYLVRFLSSL